MLSKSKDNPIADRASIVDKTELDKKDLQAHCQPLGYLLRCNRVIIPGGKAEEKKDITDSLCALDKLIHILSSVEAEHASSGFAPGFFTKELDCEKWVVNNNGLFDDQYENLLNVEMNGLVVPLPSCENALAYLKAVRETWIEREKWAAAQMNEGSTASFCSCISAWAHDNSRNPTMMQLMNQVLEQLMTTEASESCNRIVNPDSWTDMYSPEKCAGLGNDEMYLPSTSIRFLDGREDYIPAYINAALAARESIDICLCYVFQSDPVQRYILFDLLPFMARTRKVTVRILVDLMTIESAMIKSSIIAEDDGSDEARVAISREALKFLQFLPSGSPNFSDLSQKVPQNTLSFLNDLLKVISSIPNDRIQLRWWCARDKKEKFRIKSHIKCHIFDGKAKGTVITGGSNMSPMVNVTDSDMILSGEVSQKYLSMFNDLWTASSRDRSPSLISSSDSSQSSAEEPEKPPHNADVAAPTKMITKQEWTDESCRVAFLSSVPSSAGEDSILRHVIGAIGDAKNSVTMCMGHCNVPMPMAKALAAAAARGVSIRLLFNSLYTCDLRGGQRDLFLSLRDLFRIAPSIEIYVTALPSKRANRTLNENENTAPPFLHAKYFVIDSEWSAAGSWNLWTRAAFYEMEAELLVHSKAFARSLEEKFERERMGSAMKVMNENEIAYFCPQGCKLCKPFGPFYR